MYFFPYRCRRGAVQPSRGPRVPSRKKVNYVKTVLDITQKNNMAVRSEIHSHQSPDSCDRPVSNTSGQAGPHDIYMTVLKAFFFFLLKGDHTDLRAEPP